MSVSVLLIVLKSLLGAGILLLALSFLLFLTVFCVPFRKKEPSEEIQLPPGRIYEPFREDMRRWVLETRALPCVQMQITSFDGLTLYGRYYELFPGAPIELMFHGYRGNAERDLSGGVRRCREVGHNVLLVDQRCSGRSDGNLITFGIKEHRDCLCWIDHMIRYFGADVRIILTGVSMGAATVLMAAGRELPKNVIGVLADCGFSSAKDIIITVAESAHLPGRVLYPLVKLGAKLFGRFDPEEYSPVEALQTCKIPVIFFHGITDDYVPCHMSRVNYDACQTKKKLILIPGAGHGLSYPVAPKEYVEEVSAFFDPIS